MDDIELTRQLTDHDNQIKSLKHRMEGVEDVVKEIGRLATSVQPLAAEAKSTGDKVDKLSWTRNRDRWRLESLSVPCRFARTR